MKIIYVNCGVKNYLKEDHRSYNTQLMQLRKESLKQLQACTGIRTLDLCDTGITEVKVWNCDDLPVNNNFHSWFNFVLCPLFWSILM